MSGISFSSAPASLPAARSPKGCGTWADVQCPRGRCAPAPGLPPGPCYCGYQAGGGSLTLSPQVWQAGPEGEQPRQAGRSCGKSAWQWPNVPSPLHGTLSGLAAGSSSSGKALLHMSHVPLTSLAGGGGDEPGMPGSSHRVRLARTTSLPDEDGAGGIPTSIPESPFPGDGGFEACAGGVIPPAMPHASVLAMRLQRWRLPIAEW